MPEPTNSLLAHNIPIHAVSSDHATTPVGLREIDVASRPLPLNTSTRDRLIAWANSPGGRGEIPGELELGGMFQVNMEVSRERDSCPSRSDRRSRYNVGVSEAERIFFFHLDNDDLMPVADA